MLLDLLDGHVKPSIPMRNPLREYSRAITYKRPHRNLDAKPSEFVMHHTVGNRMRSTKGAHHD